MIILIPGTVTVYIPFQILQSERKLAMPPMTVGSALAGVLIVVGLSVLLRCVWDFFAAGRGTLAPFDPPTRLVVKGLYRFTRNPMYNGVLAVLLGEAWLFRSMGVLQFAAIMLVIFHTVVVLYEERALRAQFGEDYRAYQSVVPRWGFTARPFRGAQAGAAVSQ
jgi:protein-S-isoprenylcysteine O-methyltransferase Ste14